jgi:hypothetical protein
MLPDIRLVLTAVATTVLIFVGLGLIASVRVTHQGLSGGSLVSSSADSVISQRWPLSENAFVAHDQAVDGLAPEEKAFAARALASVPAAVPERRIDPETAAIIIREPEIAIERTRSAASDPATTASITPSEEKKTTAPAPQTAATVPLPPVPAKRTARSRPRPVPDHHPHIFANSDDKNLLGIIFGFDETH